MSTEREITLLGTPLRVRTSLDAEEITRAAEEVDRYVQNIQAETGLTDTRKLLLVALLNQTMEMRRMKNRRERTSDFRSLSEWAETMTTTIRSVLD